MINKKWRNGEIRLAGYNDLQTLNPQLAQEWNYDKNGDLTPEKVGINYSKIVWWICEKGHEWQTTVSHRTIGNSCPVCANKKIIPGINDLASTGSEIALEWNYEKNGDLLPTMFSAKSDKRVWWKCRLCGHEWECSIENRHYNRRCPNCKGGYKQITIFDKEK